MSKSTQALLEHILQSIDLALTYIDGVSKAEFLEDVGLQDKVIRRLAIIGEATKGLSKEFRNKHSKIPWKDIAGMRDILVHEYYDVDTVLVWKVSNFRLRTMRKYLAKIMSEMK